MLTGFGQVRFRCAHVNVQLLGYFLVRIPVNNVKVKHGSVTRTQLLNQANQIFISQPVERTFGEGCRNMNVFQSNLTGIFKRTSILINRRINDDSFEVTNKRRNRIVLFDLILTHALENLQKPIIHYLQTHFLIGTIPKGNTHSERIKKPVQGLLAFSLVPGTPF